jgi:UDP-N-acetylmuramoylalanine--D-glutamate ligase
MTHSTLTLDQTVPSDPPVAQLNPAMLERPELGGRQLLVVGLGESGLAMAQWAAFGGATVTVMDTRHDPPQRQTLMDRVPQATFVASPLDLGAIEQRMPAGIDLVAWSQGLSPTQGEAAGLHAALTARGVPIWGELDFFAVELVRLRAAGHACTVLAITGTNGKTTTTQLVGHLCEAVGLRTRVAGNISPAALQGLYEAVQSNQLPQVWVLELASFQLALSCRFEADASAILNLTEDHLDWHDDMAAYRAAKQKIHAGRSLCVVNRDDPASRPDRLTLEPLPGVPVPRKVAPQPPRPMVSFGLDLPRQAPGFGVQTEGGLDWLVEAVADDSPGRRVRRAAAQSSEGHASAQAETLRLRRLMPADALRLRGAHNRSNVLAALALAQAAGAPMAGMLRALASFEAGAHRCTTIASIDGVDYVDDSKGTNVGATVAALVGSANPVILIAGGDGKGQDFSPLLPAVARCAKAVLLIGRDAARLQDALAPAGVPIERCDTLQAAVRRSAQLAQPGQTVLLSPACASLDMFRNYVHRAEVFIEAVRELAHDRGQPC